MNKLRKQWLWYSGAGLAVFGMGACMVVESAFLKWQGEPTWKWVAAGTFSLVVLNAGLSIFGEGVVRRMQYLQKKSRD
jgi:hypothetical protein